MLLNQLPMHSKLLQLVVIVTAIFLGTGLCAQAATILYPQGGGTGTSTPPVYGQVLVGNAGGTYTLTATSTLGIGTVATSINGLITPGTNVTFTGSGTAGSPYVVNATGGSSFGYPFPGNATSTAITFSGGLTGTLTGSISGNAATVTNGVYTTTFNNLFDNRLSATTTLPNITTLAGLSLPYSQLTGVPAFDTFGYPFPSNATSTLITFNGGATIANNLTLSGISGTQCLHVVSGVVSGTGTDCGSSGGSVTSVSGTYPILSSGTTAITISTAFGTTTSNTFAGTQTFTNPLTDGTLSGLIGGNNGATYAVSTSSLNASITGNAGTVTNGVYTTTFNSLFDPRFVTDLAATTSVASITTLPNLSLPYSQVTGGPTGTVTGVTATYPILSTGGTAPVISTAFGTTTSNTYGGTQTFTNAPDFASINNGTVNISNHVVFSTPTTTPIISTGLTYSGTWPAGIGGVAGNLTVNTTQNISTLSNLSTAGFVQTTSGGVLSSAALTSGQVTTALGFTPGTGTVTSVSGSGGTTGLTLTGGAITGSGTLTLGGNLNVANGGTGSTTLTGILKGAGTGSVVTAVGDTDYQKPISLTTTGSSGAATFIGDTLNVPVYSGGGTPSGASSTIQYNKNGSFGGVSDVNTDGTQLSIGTTSTAVIPKLLFVEGNQSGGVARIQRDFPSTPTNSVIGTYDILLNETGAGSLADQTGPAQTFGVSLAGGAENIDADVFGFRDGADTSGGYTVRTYDLGTPVQDLIFNHLGQAAIASTTPAGSTNSLLALGTTNGVNFTTATTSFSGTGGINIASGCYAINGTCIGGGSGAVSSVSNADGSLTISPTTGAVVASLNLTNANTWSGTQTFNNVVINGTCTGSGCGGGSGVTGTQGQDVYIGPSGNAVATSTIFTLPNGFTGIGTTSPQSSLDVNGNLTFDSAATSTITTGTQFGSLVIATAFAAKPGNITITPGNGNFAPGGNLYLDGGQNTNTSVNSSIQMQTNGGNGNVGIGTTSPYDLLSIGNTGGIGFSTATSTWNTTGGININAGCYAKAGTCLALGSGTVNTGVNGNMAYYAASTNAVSTNSFVTYANGGGTPALTVGTSGSPGTLIATNGSTQSSISGSATSTFAFAVNIAGNIGNGTTTPTARLVVVAASTTAGTIETGYIGQVAIISGLENGVVKLFEEIDQWGHLITSGDAPTVTGGTSSVSGNDRNGTVTVTGTALTSVTLTFAHPYLTAPDCTESDNSTAITADISSISTTQVVFGFSVGVSSGTVWYQCAGHQ